MSDPSEDQSPTREEMLNELEFLRFYKKAVYGCLGPADGDIDRAINEDYEKKTGRKVPAEYSY